MIGGEQMEWEYIIVQAGGKGTRMQSLTRNKPKAMVPVDNLPILFHLFKKYPDKKYIIIGDYKLDVLRKYLEVYSTVEYELIDGSGKKGTCAGIAEALTLVPNKVPFMLIWSDLILNQNFDMTHKEKGNYVALSGDFTCRWQYSNQRFIEEPSEQYGVAGLFFFEDKNVLCNVPEQGEFVRWLSEQDICFQSVLLEHTREYGLIETYWKLEPSRCRPFNRITDYGAYIIKEGIDAKGRELAVRERSWYEKVYTYDFKNIPSIFGLRPLKMEKIDGKNIYMYAEASVQEKKIILKSIVDCLKKLHELGCCDYNEESFYDAYIGKTFDRIKSIQNLVPFAHDPYIVINGKKCRNVFYFADELEHEIDKYKPDCFRFIHGDCTFSNIMLREKDCEPVLIDPRGYFGKTSFYGDVAYDYAKLYYSIVGNYDQFNLKNFELHINENDVQIEIVSNGWESLENYFFELIDGEVDRRQIRLIHAIIWLSLTTYAWEDYDSICGAFYNGLTYLEDVL